jgi:hypothetical protein
METIIKCAINGGYSFTLDWNDKNDFTFPLLDPLFWQALGKVCEWDKIHYELCAQIKYGEFGNPGECDCGAKIEWRAKALQFYDINLAEGLDSAINYLWELIKK